MKARAVVYGAISLVNGISIQKGATLGISLRTEATIESEPGTGITVQAQDISNRLAKSTVQHSVPKKELEKNRIIVSVKSEIPTGYGLKSSSAISSAISLACHRIFKNSINDRQVLLAGVDASIESKVSITGAYDDACSCYYGGFNVTDNVKRGRVKFGRAPPGLSVVIFIPRSRKRGNAKELRNTPHIFEKAWSLAKKGCYWDAMNVNGFATASTLKSEPVLIADLIGAGALGASVSGNGPAVAAVARDRNIAGIKRAFSKLEGRVITSKINNKKATVREV